MFKHCLAAALFLAAIFAPLPVGILAGLILANWALSTHARRKADREAAALADLAARKAKRDRLYLQFGK